MKIKLKKSQYQELRDLISYAYRSNYYSDHGNKAFDKMVDAVRQSSNWEALS